MADAKVIETPVVETPSETTKTTLPKDVEIVGYLLSVDELNTDTTDLILLNIQDGQNKVHTVSTSVAYWAKVGKFMSIDSVVSVTAEKRIKGKTHYIDANGQQHIHTGDGMNLTRITRYSESAFLRSINSKTRAEDINVISAVEEGRVSAVAQYLATTFGR